MSADDGFIELRLNRQDELAGENFWPSFTDIMTVVVMIFLMVMVVLVMYNMELVRDLQSSIEKERLAQETARATGEEKESIAMRLHATENELAQIYARLKRSEELRSQQTETIERQSKTLDEQSRSLQQQSAQITSLSSERDSLQRRGAQLGAELQTAASQLQAVASQLAASKQAGTQLEQSLAAVQARQDALSAELSSARTMIADQRREMDQSREKLQKSERTLASVESEYTELKIKYDKLVRPARSPAGRHAVEVRYGKSGSGYTIRFREGDSGDYVDLSRDKLEQRLAKLKAEHPEGLYVRVVIPDGSGLSFTEAWEFTNQMHRAYDYYFQEGSAPGATVPAQVPSGGQR